MNNTNSIVAIGTFISFICIFGIWFISMIIMRLGGATLEIRTEYILLAIPVVLILIFDILIIVKIIKIPSASIIIGYSVLTFGIWVIIWISVITWFGTYEIRENILFERITQKGELIIDYYDRDDTYKVYYYMNKKVYYVQIGEQYRYGKLIWVCPKIKNIDTDIYYLDLYEKNNKFTLSIRKELNCNDDTAAYHYPDSIIHLHGIGSFVFYWLDNMITENFDSLDLVILNEEMHTKFMER